jgi:hypothetical protein
MVVFVLPGSLFLLVPCTMEKKTSTWLSQEACTGRKASFPGEKCCGLAEPAGNLPREGDRHAGPAV